MEDLQMKKVEEKKKYHYTIGKYLPSIIQDGQINLTHLGNPGKKLHSAVWISTNELWEETACKSWYNVLNQRCKGDRAMTHHLYGGLIRIEVKPETAPFDWQYFVKKSKISGRLRRLLVRNGVSSGANPSQWYVGLKPIKKEDWLKIEIFDWAEQSWKPYKQENEVSSNN
jgi:hypothetical protein